MRRNFKISFLNKEYVYYNRSRPGIQFVGAKSWSGKICKSPIAAAQRD